MAMREITDKEQPGRKIGTLQTSHAKSAKQTKVMKVFVLDNGNRDVVLRFCLEPSGTSVNGAWPERIFALRPDVALQIAKGILQCLPDITLVSDDAQEGESILSLMRGAKERQDKESTLIVEAVQERNGTHRRDALKEVGIPCLDNGDSAPE